MSQVTEMKSKQAYSLSSMQHGMLYHSLSAPNTGVDIEQILCSLKEPLNIEVFENAWKQAIIRHSILRTCFQWEGLPEPIQVVEPKVEVSITVHDWSSLAADEQETEIQKALDEDRMIDFNLAHAPIMRLILFKLDEQEYRFLWSFHHVLLDGRSFPLILQEVFTIYEALTAKLEMDLPQPRPYSDYIDWLQKQDLKPSEKFWKKTLLGFTPPAALGSARPVEGDARVARDVSAEEIFLPVSLTEELKALSQDCGVTPNTLVQASWALLLHHYRGEDDIVFGTVRACRHWGTEDPGSMIGLFINTVPIRMEIDHSQTLMDWLQEIRKINLDVRDYEHTPFAQIQNWSDIPPETPLFDSLVVFNNQSLNTALRKLGGQWLNREFLYRGQTNFPLTLLGYLDEEMLLRIEYDCAHHDQQSVIRMLGHLRTLLKGMISSKDKPGVTLPYLTSGEEQQILVEWNDTKVDYPQDVCLHQLFEEQVQRTPNDIALVYGKAELSYEQFNQKCNQLAHHLKSLDVGPDVLVGVYATRSFEMVIALYAIQKAGGAYLPLDPEYPKDRILAILEDANAPVILTQKNLMESLPSGEEKIVSIDHFFNELGSDDSKGTESLESTSGPDHLAYAIFTSGSTGRPKGVMITHRAICNRLFWMQDEYGLTSSDAVLQKTPFSFDVSVWEFFWPLLTGARLVVAPPEKHRDSAYLVNAIQENKITTLHFVPSMLQIFLTEKDVESCTSLKRVICSGEALPYEAQVRFFERLDAGLHNLYGPTEAAVDVTYWECQRQSERKIVPIGRPVANTQIYLLDEDLNPVPIGISGELHIGGVQVARGYINRQDLTDEKFIKDIFSKNPDARLYKTGDLCQYLEDGSISYIGRNDFQVKIRGLRIETDEIQSVLNQFSSINEGIILAREDSPGDQRLVAYFVVNANESPTPAEMRKFLSGKLPEYMIPQHFIEIKKIPVTSNGKLDRRALPAPKESDLIEEKFVEASNQAEKIIAEIWKKILDRKQVGVRSTFFELGGHSLLMMKVLSELQNAFTNDLTIVSLFQYPTIEALAKFLNQTSDKKPSLSNQNNLIDKQKTLLAQQRKLAASRRRP